MRIALDWDATLVDADGEFLPGAQATLRWLRKNRHHVLIVSARASYANGKLEIEEKLRQHRIVATVYSKPEADIYVDDKGLHFAGDWPSTLADIRRILRG